MPSAIRAAAGAAMRFLELALLIADTCVEWIAKKVERRSSNVPEFLQYQLKPAELMWFLITIIAGALFTSVQSQGATPPTDWAAWGNGLLFAILRPLLGGLFSLWTPKTPTVTTGTGTGS